MSMWRTLYLLWLSVLFIKALPEDEDGIRLGVAIAEFQTKKLETLPGPKAKKGAEEFADLADVGRSLINRFVRF